MVCLDPNSGQIWTNPGVTFIIYNLGVFYYFKLFFIKIEGLVCLFLWIFRWITLQKVLIGLCIAQIILYMEKICYSQHKKSFTKKMLFCVMKLYFNICNFTSPFSFPLFQELCSCKGVNHCGCSYYYHSGVKSDKNCFSFCIAAA